MIRYLFVYVKRKEEAEEYIFFFFAERREVFLLVVKGYGKSLQILVRCLQKACHLTK